METNKTLELLRADTALTQENMLEITDKLEQELLELSNPSESYVKLYFMEKVIAELRKRMLDDAIDEVMRGVDQIQGAKISTKEAGVKYDYSNSDVWGDIKAREGEIAQERKDLEKRLKTLTKPTREISDEGEVLELFPPIKTSTTTLEVKYPKS